VLCALKFVLAFVVGKRSFAVKAVQELLRDTPVCAMGASVQYRYLIEQAGEHTEHVRALPSNQDVMEALLSGQCLVALWPSMQALPFMQRRRSMELSFLGAPLRPISDLLAYLRGYRGLGAQPAPGADCRRGGKRRPACFLCKLGCDLLQAYYFHRPMPAGAVERLLAA